MDQKLVKTDNLGVQQSEIYKNVLLADKDKDMGSESCIDF